jgi:hypothetical protein
MRLINTDGMALIGPGSEWFWTGLTGVVLAVTFIAIYRQLRTARSTSAIEQMQVVDRELGSARMARAELGVLLAHREGVDLAHLPGGVGEAEVVGSFWEKLGSLSRHGHIDARLLWDGSGASTAQIWWAALAPYARQIRADLQTPGFWENFEWFAGAMASFSRQAGYVGPPVDEAWIIANLDRWIGLHREALRFESGLPPEFPTRPATATPDPPDDA